MRQFHLESFVGREASIWELCVTVGIGCMAMPGLYIHEWGLPVASLVGGVVFIVGAARWSRRDPRLYQSMMLGVVLLLIVSLVYAVFRVGSSPAYKTLSGMMLGVSVFWGICSLCERGCRKTVVNALMFALWAHVTMWMAQWSYYIVTNGEVLDLLSMITGEQSRVWYWGYGERYLRLSGLMPEPALYGVVIFLIVTPLVSLDGVRRWGLLGFGIATSLASLAVSSFLLAGFGCMYGVWKMRSLTRGLCWGAGVACLGLLLAVGVNWNNVLLKYMVGRTTGITSFIAPSTVTWLRERLDLDAMTGGLDVHPSLGPSLGEEDPSARSRLSEVRTFFSHDVKRESIGHILLGHGIYRFSSGVPSTGLVYALKYWGVVGGALLIGTVCVLVWRRYFIFVVWMCFSLMCAPLWTTPLYWVALATAHVREPYTKLGDQSAVSMHNTG